jgi:hypothetical protein
MPLITTRAGGAASAFGGLGASVVAASLTSYESIATANGTGSSGVITFSSIPSTYKHLQIRSINRTTTATADGDPFNIRINGDTGANYAYHMVQGYVGATTGVTTDAASSATSMLSGYSAGNQNTASMFAPFVIDLLDYQNTNKFKTIRNLQGFDANGDGSGARYYAIRFFSGLWQSTSAITSITITAPNGNWATGSSFALYGIKG